MNSSKTVKQYIIQNYIGLESFFQKINIINISKTITQDIFLNYKEVFETLKKKQFYDQF